MMQRAIHGDAHIMHPVGDLDARVAPTVRRELGAVVDERPDRLVIDLSEVPYMDSAGLATLIEVFVSARAVGCRMSLRGLQARVRAVVEITRMDLVFPIDSIAEDAA
jgi:anti-sigma B factor antagonist